MKQHAVPIALILATTTLAMEPPRENPSLFEEPFRVEVGGKWLEQSHPAPLWYDWNGDGVSDLLVGALDGIQLYIYLNTGSPGKPEFASNPLLFCTRKDYGTVPVGCCVGFGPQVVDLNRDGYRDVVTGSMTGAVYLFAGAADGAVEPPIRLRDENGSVLNVGEIASVAVTDWDADGDLDLIAGDDRGRLTYSANLGNAGVPRFATPRRIRIADRESRRCGRTGPTVADWDGDGVADLLCGDEDGSVWFYRVIGRDTDNLPVLDAGVPLVPAQTIEEYQAAWERDDIHGKLITRPGYRTKTCLADWNGDGALDLLVGAESQVRGTPPHLTSEQIAEEKVLQARADALYEQYKALLAPLDRRIREELGIVEEGPLPSGAMEEQWQTLYEKHADEYPGLRAAWREWATFAEQLRPYEPVTGGIGWVWVYLRKADQQSAVEADGT